MLITSDYSLLFYEDRAVDLSISEQQDFQCPNCTSLLQYRDSRPRILRQEGGLTTRIKVKRYKCTDCEKLHTILPSCLIPYKHYTTEVISGVLDQVITDSDPDYGEYPGIETIKRWLDWFYRNLKRIDEILERIFRKTAPKTVPAFSLVFRIIFPDWLERLIRIIYNSGETLVT